MGKILHAGWVWRVTAAALLIAGCANDEPRAHSAAPVASGLRSGGTFGPKRVAFVLVDNGAGLNLTAEQARTLVTGPMTGGQPALREFYLENSYGTQDLEGRVLGPYSYPTAICASSQMASSLKPMVMSDGGGAFNHYIWYMGQPIADCSFQDGSGEMGTPDRPSDDSWLNGVASCPLLPRVTAVNMGLAPSSALSCGAVPFVDEPGVGCVSATGADPFDAMGTGCLHVNGYQKVYAGWLQGCNAVRVRGSGTFTLLPLELPCDGAQLLQIPMPRARSLPGDASRPATALLTHYYLELRTGRGIDVPLANSVQVRVSEELRGRPQRGVPTFILDMDPSTPAIDGLFVGQPFTDPAGGVTFTVTAIDAYHASIAVTMDADGGGPLCIDGSTPFPAPGPTIESCSPTPASTPGVGGMYVAPSGGAGGRSGRGVGGQGGVGGQPGSGSAGTGAGGIGGDTSPGTGGADVSTGSGGQPGTGGVAISAGSGGQPAARGTGGNGTRLAGRGSGGCSCTLTNSRHPLAAPFALIGLMLLISRGPSPTLSRSARRRR